MNTPLAMALMEQQQPQPMPVSPFGLGQPQMLAASDWQERGGLPTRVTSGAAVAPVAPPANPNVGFSRDRNIAGLVKLLMQSRGMTQAQAEATAAQMGK